MKTKLRLYICKKLNVRLGARSEYDFCGEKIDDKSCNGCQFKGKYLDEVMPKKYKKNGFLPAYRCDKLGCNIIKK